MMLLRRDSVAAVALPKPGISYENLGISKAGAARGGAAAVDAVAGSLFAIANADGPIEVYSGHGTAAARTRTFIGNGVAAHACAADYADGATTATACCGYDRTTDTSSSLICPRETPTCRGYEGFAWQYRAHANCHPYLSAISHEYDHGTGTWASNTASGTRSVTATLDECKTLCQTVGCDVINYIAATSNCFLRRVVQPFDMSSCTDGDYEYDAYYQNVRYGACVGGGRRHLDLTFGKIDDDARHRSTPPAASCPLSTPSTPTPGCSPRRRSLPSPPAASTRSTRGRRRSRWCATILMAMERTTSSCTAPPTTPGRARTAARSSTALATSWRTATASAGAPSPSASAAPTSTRPRAPSRRPARRPSRRCRRPACRRRRLAAAGRATQLSAG